MSARNQAAKKTADHQQVLKSLLKLPGNKHCADCKRTAHPRWASWNLGVFVCIRCSGIHRGMGTHISRVKSVDLDSWTDEQLQSMLRWGNSRANKYWEAKLAAGHVPSDSKMENFIRTKYESKRWVMDGGIPDPATLDDSDAEDTPLRVVQEKQKAEAATTSPPRKAPPPPQNLFDDDPIPPPTATSPPPAPVQQAQKQAQKPADSLLGLDFFGAAPSAAPRPASAASNPGSTGGGASRPDLNRSILSLYSSGPKQTPKTHQSTNSGSFGAFAGSPPVQSPTGGSGLNDLAGAFGDLNFAASPPPQPAAAPPKPSPFANLTAGLTKPSSTTSTYNSNRSNDPFASFGNSTSSVKANPAPTATSSSMGDLFDLGSTPSYQSKPVAQTQPSKPLASSGLSFDNAWATPAASSTNNSSSAGFNWSTPATTTTTASKPPPRPTVTDDDDFGAFSSGGGGGGGFGGSTASSNNKSGKPVTYDEDLFKNVWG